MKICKYFVYIILLFTESFSIEKEEKIPCHITCDKRMAQYGTCFTCKCVCPKGEIASNFTVYGGYDNKEITKVGDKTREIKICLPKTRKEGQLNRKLKLASKKTNIISINAIPIDKSSSNEFLIFNTFKVIALNDILVNTLKTQMNKINQTFDIEGSESDYKLGQNLGGKIKLSRTSIGDENSVYFFQSFSADGEYDVSLTVSVDNPDKGNEYRFYVLSDERCATDSAFSGNINQTNINNLQEVVATESLPSGFKKPGYEFEPKCESSDFCRTSFQMTFSRNGCIFVSRPALMNAELIYMVQLTKRFTIDSEEFSIQYRKYDKGIDYGFILTVAGFILLGVSLVGLLLLMK